MKEVAQMIKKKDLHKDLQKIKFLSKEAKDFLKAGMTQKPEKRLSTEEMLNHPFLAPTIIPSIKMRQPSSLQESLFLIRAGHKVPQQYQE